MAKHYILKTKVTQQAVQAFFASLPNPVNSRVTSSTTHSGYWEIEYPELNAEQQKNFDKLGSA